GGGELRVPDSFTKRNKKKTDLQVNPACDGGGWTCTDSNRPHRRPSWRSSRSAGIAEVALQFLPFQIFLKQCPALCRRERCHVAWLGVLLWNVRLLVRDIFNRKGFGRVALDDARFARSGGRRSRLAGRSPPSSEQR